MKTKITLSLAIVLLMNVSTPVYSNDEKYVEAMQKNIKTVYEAATMEELQGAVNAFQRIAGVETDKWEPLYYAAFGNLMLCTREKDPAKKDQYIASAFELIAKAKAIADGESELYALEGFGMMLSVSVDPGTRGPQYAGRAVQAYEKALKLNPDNPRAWALLAQMQFGTAQFFGSSSAEACETNNTAASKFASFQSGNPLTPRWGNAMVTTLKEKCK
ncbi:MAG TPA: tetratricopeptide repeat protein [Chryseosolibacter sp.]|nr:tetratricopeptide repeat protein [Chryseosolibacter sp.]